MNHKKLQSELNSTRATSIDAAFACDDIQNVLDQKANNK